MNGFDLQIFLQAFEATFPAVSALLPAAPRRLFGWEMGTIDRERANVKLGGHPKASSHVGCEYGSCVRQQGMGDVEITAYPKDHTQCH